MVERRRRSQSRSASVVRRLDSRIRTRSQSRSPNHESSVKRPYRKIDSEEFYTPYRCLIPSDSAGSVIGKGGAFLRRLQQDTGVEISLLKSEDNPGTLDDRICVINGSPRTKDDALLWLLGRQ